MRNSLLLIATGLMSSTSAFAVQRDTEADALRHKKLESTPIYGELYQSLTFDGEWSSVCPGQVFRYKGEFDRNYAAWVDCFGDVIVGYYDNITGESSMNTVIDHKRVDTKNNIVSLTYAGDGSMILYVGKVGTKKLSVYLSEKENISKWEKTTFKTDVSVDKLSACNIGAQSMVSVLGDGKVSVWSNQKGLVKKVAEMNVTGKQELFKIQALNEKVYLTLNNEMFVCEGEIKPVAELGSAMIASDFIPTSEGYMGVSKSEKGLTVSKINNGKVKSYNIKTDSVCGSPVIDMDDAKQIYFTKTVNGISEVYKAVNKRGTKWTVEAVTENSPFNNRDVVAVQNSAEEMPVQFMWLQESLKDVKVNTLSSVKMNIFQPQITDITSPEQIRILMKKVADWQLGRSYIDKHKNDWQWGAFYTGLMAAHERLQSPFYWNEMMNLGQYYDWALLKDQLHADRLLVCDLYLYMYEHSGKKNDYMIKPTKYAMDLHTSRKAKIDPRFKDSDYKMEWWSWADALYMAPISFFEYTRVTGDKSASEFAYRQWNAVEDYLYSKEDSLFYRDDRYFTAKSTHGKKVFWARGNGWVLGSMPRIMDSLPKDSEYRKHYEKLFKEMAAKIKNIQMPEGLWTCSLYDPEELNIGESSGSGFFGYALAWGINNGLLDKAEYEEALMKAWKGMTNNVTPYGKLGYVQQIAGDPYPFFYHQYHTYASGAFLLFANEMIKYFENK